MGFGTSLMLLMKIQEIAKDKYGIDVEGEACDLGSAKGSKCDFVAASTDLAQELEESGMRVIGINSLLDDKEIEEKVMPVIQEIAALESD